MNEHAQATGRDEAHDVAIVGGGLVGASLAIALSRAGRDVALVEATPPGAPPPVFDQRNLSFAEATVNALTALGVMQRLQLPASPIRRIHVSRAGDFGRVCLAASDYGREAFGQVVVASDFGQALEAALAALPRLARYRPCRFVGLEPGTGAVRTLRLQHADGGEQRVPARLLVGADGTRSEVREALGIAAPTHDYGHDLFVARLRSDRAPAGDAWERFGDHGPTALLPRGDRHYGVVHGVAREDADAVAALDDAAWLARLQRAFGWRAGRFLETGARSRYPAVRVVADALAAPRAELVGYAAQTLHPVGAQGFNLGLRDALTLAELLEQGGDPGSAAVLDAYRQRRREDRDRSMAFSHGLARATMQSQAWLRPLRSAGMAAVARLPSLQGWLVGGAMGYRGSVPRLCRTPASPGTGA
jgi:2-octaprenyl-6-methoxyphenol hydroxylase